MQIDQIAHPVVIGKSQQIRNFCNDSPTMTQYCPHLDPSNQTSQEVTHPSTTLAEARLTAEF